MGTSGLPAPISRAQRKVRRAIAHAQPWPDRLARAGYLAKGCLFVLVGALTCAAAIGLGGQATDPTGAMVTLAHAPAGRLILAALAPALLAHAAFRIALVLLGEPYADRGPAHSLVRRMANAGGAIIYVGLSTVAGALALGVGGHVQTDKDAEARHWSARVLAAPYGRYLLMAIAAAVLIAAIVQVVRVASPNTVRRRLHVEKMTDRERAIVSVIGRVALLARAVILSAIGYFLLKAAHRWEPGVARGPAGALHALWQLPHGSMLLVATAAGLISLGVYGLIEVRWRRLFEK